MARSTGAGGECHLTFAENDHQPPEEIPESRPAGPDPPRREQGWTTKRVRLYMVAAHREGRRRYMGQISSARSALDWPSLYLPLTHPERSRAERFLSDAILCEAEGRKFATHCRLRGWSRATALRWINWALQIIADSLNDDEARRLGA